ncbi:hypothetical protein ACL7TT_19210 [Microbulbifer sp. 2304DJ12-6]|uniref:hypothetical protein n=1 Tax=Microbulbifer sp. 2304DJ12-6 TaxID=3233340 RepID=UPI0039B049C5
MKQVNRKKVSSRYLWKFIACLLASSFLPVAYVLLVIAPGLKATWFGVAVVSAIASSLIILVLPLKRTRYYIPSSVVVSVAVYGVIQEYLVFSHVP